MKKTFLLLFSALFLTKCAGNNYFIKTQLDPIYFQGREAKTSKVFIFLPENKPISDKQLYPFFLNECSRLGITLTDKQGKADLLMIYTSGTHSVEVNSSSLVTANNYSNGKVGSTNVTNTETTYVTVPTTKTILEGYLFISVYPINHEKNEIGKSSVWQAYISGDYEKYNEAIDVYIHDLLISFGKDSEGYKHSLSDVGEDQTSRDGAIHFSSGRYAPDNSIPIAVNVPYSRNEEMAVRMLSNPESNLIRDAWRKAIAKNPKLQSTQSKPVSYIVSKVEKGMGGSYTAELSFGGE